jgi:hypothetical protein
MSTEIATQTDRIEHAKLLATADMLPPHLRGKPANVLWTMEMADGLDLTLAQAVNGVVVINGQPSLKAETMRALVMRAGHRFRVDTQTDAACVVSVARREYPDDVQQFTYSSDDAKRAGLTGGNWQKHPKAMLLARATSSACRAVFPDVIQGFMAPEEVVEYGRPTTPAPPPVPQAPTTVTREPAPAPEPPADVDLDTGEIVEAEVVEEPSDSGQWQRLAIIAGNLGMDSREDKHALIMAVCGRAITSAKDLTRAEAEHVESELRRIEQSPEAQVLAADIASGGTIL